MEVKKSVVNSLFWAFLDQFSSKGISIIASIFLARILAPSDFGLISLVYIFSAIAQELADGGLGASLIRTKLTTYKDYSTIFFTNVFIALLLYLLCFTLAPYIAIFYNLPNLNLLIRVYCLIFVINSFSSIHIFVLIKKMEFRKIMLLNLPAILLGTFMAIYLAHLGYGVWSIVAMQLISQTFFAIFLWINSNEVRLFFSLKILKRHYDFGLKIMTIALFTSGFKNITNSVIGKVYSITDLGYYDRSKTLSAYPSTIFVGILSKVFYPFFSSINDEKKLKAGYKKVIRISFYFSTYIMCLLITVAHLFIEVVLGKQWLPAVPYFQLLCLAAILTPVNTFNLNILKVKGLSNLILKIEIINIIIAGFALLTGVFFSIIQLIYCLLLAEIFIFIHNSYKSQKYHQYKFFNQVLDFLPTIVIAGISYLSVFYSNKIITFQPNIFSLLLQTVIFSFTYFILSYFLKNYSFNFLINIIISKIKK